MKAMILAAGKGKRLQPLTNTTPKPLIKIGDKALIEYHIEKLQSIGITDLIINISHLAQKIQKELGDGERYGVNIQYSIEPGEPLETGGGIVNALPLLGTEPFLVINSDIWTDYPLEKIMQHKLTGLAHLIFVDNPFGSDGDFALEADQLSLADENKFTFAGIAKYHPSLFKAYENKRFPLFPVLQQGIAENKITGEYYGGVWSDVGTMPSLESLREEMLSVD